nr:MAG TPA: hypothetical protein [Caudoviricetes sp.]
MDTVKCLKLLAMSYCIVAAEVWKRHPMIAVILGLLYIHELDKK